MNDWWYPYKEERTQRQIHIEGRNHVKKEVEIRVRLSQAKELQEPPKAKRLFPRALTGSMTPKTP